ncbi:unnamed protein product [Callosobruchus maculatus]|uniref:J domain-containing protein n=2 Tax=Callosobruchus maculatus TaxID=64391 RepID=A0A653D665_CALMS|nr:unnamed protein product [Callosobruchus maculatus]
MSSKRVPCPNEAMEKMIGNMTAEMQNVDGQYVPLGFTASPPNNSESINWTPQANYMNPYAIHNSEAVEMDQYPPQAFSFLPQVAPLYETNSFKKSPEFEVYNPVPNGASEMGFVDYRLLLPQQHMVENVQEHPTQQQSTSNSPNHAHLIEHLVGNWMVPNNSGTYSPFGNPEMYKPTVFDVPCEKELPNVMHPNEEFKLKSDQTLDGIQFNRETRKPRMVAEVKPMRPSYSDVLTKPVPQTTAKLMKNEAKDAKPKKDNKKNTKAEKDKKSNSLLNRSNTNNDIKDLPSEKSIVHNKTDRNRPVKSNQLNRKWASLDDISDTQTSKVDDSKKKQKDDQSMSKCNSKSNPKKPNKPMKDITDPEADAVKIESFSITKNGLKKVNKPNARQKPNDSFGSSERPPGKRGQRVRKKENHVPFGFIGQKLKQYTKGWWKIFVVFLFWLFHLISDICSLSLHLISDMATHSWTWLIQQLTLVTHSVQLILKSFRIFTWVQDKFARDRKDDSTKEKPSLPPNGLQHNINMPTTGDEAMKRLLACKGKDPYSILGVTPTCTDDDIKRYYKRQAFLVHPDKNNQPGAEEAFKILVHAFDMIGEPGRRAAYDRGVVESAQVVQAWSELTELLQKLQAKVEAAANTIRCSSCGLRHRRVKVDRPSYAARNCVTCKIHHAAREGDIWAEAKVFGFLWHYYACMEGAVYDITEWAGCQKDSLKHLRQIPIMCSTELL